MTLSNTYPAIIRDLATGEQLLQVQARITVRQTEANLDDWKGWYIQPDGFPVLDLGEYQLEVPGRGKGRIHIATRPSKPATAGQTIHFQGMGGSPV